MSDDVEKVAGRLAKLEVTVAEGFHDTASKLHQAELRDFALSQKIDVQTESLRADIKAVLDAVGSLTDEMRRASESIRKEHETDRKLTRLTLLDHTKRTLPVETRSTER
jgi:hypothetical protein